MATALSVITSTGSGRCWSHRSAVASSGMAFELLLLTAAAQNAGAAARLCHNDLSLRVCMLQLLRLIVTRCRLAGALQGERQ